MTTADRFDRQQGGPSLVITKVTRRTAAPGTWVQGLVGADRFEALVFPEHADCPEWELRGSRISKLWLSRDGHTVFQWDRGLDLGPGDRDTSRAVDLIVRHLADHVYGTARGPAGSDVVRAPARRNRNEVVTVNGVRFATARQATQHARAAGRKAIRLGGQTLVVQPEEADRLAAAGVYFAYLTEHQGRIVTVPVNG